jgi:hypothetical protein
LAAPLVGGDLLADDVVAQLDALIADEHRRARDQLLDLVLALAAERAVKKLLSAGLFFSDISTLFAVKGDRDATRDAPGQAPPAD